MSPSVWPGAHASGASPFRESIIGYELIPSKSSQNRRAVDPSKEGNQKRAAHLKSGALALIVGVAGALVVDTNTHGFPLAEFAFAFILTYTIALGVFSKGT